MSSKSAALLAQKFNKKVVGLDSIRGRVEACYASGGLRVTDVEAMYAGLFLQVVVAYEATIENFVLGLMVRPGGVHSANPRIKSRVRVRSYSHALAVAAGPGRKFPQWIGKRDLEDVSRMLLVDGAPFAVAGGVLDWSYVEKCRYIRNAIAHPSDHAVKQFEKHVIQSTPLHWRERRVSAFLRGSGSGGQTRWEVLVAGLRQFIVATVV